MGERCPQATLLPCFLAACSASEPTAATPQPLLSDGLSVQLPMNPTPPLLDRLFLRNCTNQPSTSYTMPLLQTLEIQSLLLSNPPKPLPPATPIAFQKSPGSAFREVNEIKQFLLTLGAAGLAGNGAQQTAPAAAAAASSMALLGAALAGAQSTATPAPPPRKRPAPMPPQPECPVALRPISTCNMPSQYLNGWNWFMPGVRQPSPSLAAPPSSNDSIVPVAQDIQTDAGKWSNPSSVESNGQKTDISSGESGNIDIVGMDGSESSTSSTSTQAMITSPSIQQQFPQLMKDVAPLYPFAQKPADLKAPSFLYNLPKMDQTAVAIAPIAATLPTSNLTNVNGTEKKHRKPVSDDYVKLIRQHDLNGRNVSDIQIPVPEAVQCDPDFNALAENQIVQQILQGKRYDEMDLRDAMTQLCKKLAEKRVFGPKLMSQTTVAGPNHSTYTNLPEDGIIYIQHVCREVLGNKFKDEDQFWEAFRDAMRKLAARCRRVRHAKKTKSVREEGIQLAQLTSVVNGMKKDHEWTECSVAQTLQSLSIPPPPPHEPKIPTTHTMTSTPLERSTPFGETIQNMINLVKNETLSLPTDHASLLQHLGIPNTAAAFASQSILPTTSVADPLQSQLTLLKMAQTADLLCKREPTTGTEPLSP